VRQPASEEDEFRLKCRHESIDPIDVMVRRRSLQVTGLSRVHFPQVLRKRVCKHEAVQAQTKFLLKMAMISVFLVGLLATSHTFTRLKEVEYLPLSSLKPEKLSLSLQPSALLSKCSLGGLSKNNWV
jgi:hypothetical protein